VFVSSVGGFVPFSVSVYTVNTLVNVVNDVAYLLQGLGAYSVSKTALFGLTRAMSVELGNENIRVNCLAPGVIKTHFSSAVSVVWRRPPLR